VIDNINEIYILKYLGYSTGRVAFIAAFVILMAGISIPCLFVKLMPRWIAITGLILAACAELSTFSLLFYDATILLPIPRFESFIWDFVRINTCEIKADGILTFDSKA
jgi:hypothetical protein